MKALTTICRFHLILSMCYERQILLLRQDSRGQGKMRFKILYNLPVSCV
jgi:hypothetical protein